MGLLWAHPSRGELSRPNFDVELQLVIELIFQLVPPKRAE